MRRLVLLLPFLLAGCGGSAGHEYAGQSGSDPAPATTRAPTQDQIADAAYNVCTDAIADQLRSPSTAQFSDRSLATEAIDDNTYLFSGTVDSQNGFGAIGRSDFGCKIVFDPATHALTATTAAVA